MLEHYGISQQQFADLAKKGVSFADLFHGVALFEAEKAPLSKVSLMHYADKHGDFTERRFKMDHVACAVFDNLTMKEKIEIGAYLEWVIEYG